jgi:hypothetical protein
VETVAPHARLVELLRDREPVGELRVGAVERSVEAGHLRRSGPLPQQRPDRGQVVRLVQRCQRHQPLQVGQHRRVEHDRRRVARAPVDDPVPDRRGRLRATLVEPAVDHLPRPPRVGHLPGPEAALRQHRAVRALHDQPRPIPDSLDLPPEAPLRADAGWRVEQLELHARAAGVDDEHRPGHAHAPSVAPTILDGRRPRRLGDLHATSCPALRRPPRQRSRSAIRRSTSTCRTPPRLPVRHGRPRGPSRRASCCA